MGTGHAGLDKSSNAYQRGQLLILVTWQPRGKAREHPHFLT